MDQNPFIYESEHSTTIGFQTKRKTCPEPLWWTGSGFKDLAVVRSHPEEFASREEAQAKVRSELLDFIKKYRPDQAHLVSGW